MRDRCAGASSTHADDRPADLVLRGGRIATMDAARTSRAGRRGPRRADRRRSARTRTSRRWIGPRTRVIELRGRTVTPGFRDAHVHPVSAGLEPAALRPRRLARSRRLPRGHRRRTRRRTRTSRGSAAAAGRWRTSRAATPHREDLDRDRAGPAGLPESRDGHTAWVNARALELAGITADSLDPADGRIERDADGTPDRHAPGRRGGRSSSGSSRRRPPTTSWRRSASPRPSSTRSGSPHWQDAIVDARRRGARLRDAGRRGAS